MSKRKETKVISEDEALLNEEIEKLFKLKISSSGNYIEIIFKTGSRTVVIDYSEFMKLRNSIRALVEDREIKAQLKGEDYQKMSNAIQNNKVQ